MNTLLGQRIREQRKEKGWTIEQFAERVDCQQIMLEI